MRRAWNAVVVALLVASAGCAGLVGSETGGQVEANVVPSPPADATTTPLSEIDDDRLRRATKEAVTTYESNGTAEIAAVSIPERKLDATRNAYERLSERPEGKYGRLVSYRGYTVRVLVTIYA